LDNLDIGLLSNQQKDNINSSKKKKRVFGIAVALLVFAFFFLGTALLLAPRHVKISNNHEPGKELISNGVVDDDKKSKGDKVGVQYPLEVDAVAGTLRVNFTRHIVIESGLPISLKNIAVSFVFMYSGIKPRLVLDTDMDSYVVNIKPNESVDLILDHQTTLTKSDTDRPELLSGALLAMQQECDENKTVTFKVQVTFCHKFALILCRIMAGIVMPFEVPCKEDTKLLQDEHVIEKFKKINPNGESR
jgi:hypothetical protein